jgi:serine phosphatase RsbU (regulator of sigma subunit)
MEDVMADDALSGVLADRERLRSLQRVCVGAEPDEAFDRFASLVKRLLGVPVALVSLVDDQHQYFPGQTGLPEPWGTKRETPLTHSFCQFVVIEGRPKVFPDARIYAQVRDNLAIPDLGVVAYAGMPLTDGDGRVLGSLCAIDTTPRAWSANELEVLQDLAEACSSELRLRIARELAEDARRRTESVHDQLTMLTAITETLVGTLDIDDALNTLGAALTPKLADWCLITLVDPNGAIRRVGAAHRDPHHAADVDRFADLMVSGLGAKSAVLAVQRTGRPIRRAGETPETMLERSTNPEMADIAGRLGYAAFLIAPIPAPVSQRTLGSITLVNGPHRPAFTEADERAASDIGRRAGLALDNSRLYRQQRHVAEVLQHSMLTDLPRIEGVELHARYVPAQDGTAVGGDWYDAFAQPDGSVVLAVGDVSGHDIEAAAAMGQLRNLVRGDAYAREDEPGTLLIHLDRAVRGLRVQAAATAVLARLRRDGDGYSVAFSNAGHPPPVLLRPDGTVEIWWETPEPLLGLIPREFRATYRRRVAAGSTLLLYTDGLVEDPAHMIDEGIARIGAVLAGNGDLPAEELCSRLLASVSRRADDIALLLIRVG